MVKADSPAGGRAGARVNIRLPKKGTRKVDAWLPGIKAHYYVVNGADSPAGGQARGWVEANPWALQNLAGRILVNGIVR